MDWEDYLLARKAWWHFRSLGDTERAEEYDLLCTELVQVINQRIDREP